MNEENNQDTSNQEEKGGVIGALHKENTLPSLRTYQGDVASFIKEKNESVTTIAVKENEKKREKEREETVASSKKGEGFKINFVALILSVTLILAGVLAVFFIINGLQKEDPVISIKQDLIPYNSELSLANITKDTLAQELKNVSQGSGVTAVRISDTNGNNINTVSELLSFLGVNPPGTITRSMKPEFFLGALNSGKETTYFLIVKVDDFGRAFSGMLDWEPTLYKDLSFLAKSSTPTTEVLTDLEENVTTTNTTPVWKDLIVKNKDTRALVSNGTSLIAYTFLDKNTILLTNNADSIGEISSNFASRSVVR